MGMEGILVRKKKLSDDDVLCVVEQVMTREGPIKFRLELAAHAVGLSPATLLQRFGSKQRMIVKVFERSNTAFEDAFCDFDESRNTEAVISMLEKWAEGFDGSSNMAEQMQWLAEDMRQSELTGLAMKRFNLMRSAISVRLPKMRLDHDEAVRLIEAQWHGILIRSGVEGVTDLSLKVRKDIATLFVLLEL